MLGQAEIKEKMFNAGVEAAGTAPEQLIATVNAEMARLGKLIKDANIRDE